MKAGDGNTGAPLCCGVRLTFSITANRGRAHLLAPSMPLLETVQATEKGCKAARLRVLRRTGEEIHVTLFRTSSVCVNNHVYLCFLSQMGLEEAPGVRSPCSSLNTSRGPSFMSELPPSFSASPSSCMSALWFAEPFPLGKLSESLLLHTLLQGVLLHMCVRILV